MDNRRLFLAVVLSLAVLLAWNYIFPPPKPPAEPIAETPIEAGADPLAPSTPTTDTAVEAAPQSPASASGEPTTAEPPAIQPVAAAGEETVILEGETTRVELTNRGARLVSFVLLDHVGADGRPLDLVRHRDNGPYPFSLTDGTGARSPLDDALFAVRRLSEEEGVLFEYVGSEGRASKRFALAGKDILDVAIEVPGRNDWSFVLGPGLRNEVPGASGGLEQREAIYEANSDFERINPEKADTAEALAGPGLSWAGFHDNYFLTVVLPRGPVRQAVFEPVLVSPVEAGASVVIESAPPRDAVTAEREAWTRDLLLRVEPGTPSFAGRMYWGPKDYGRLEELPGGLERTVGLGSLAILARPMMLGLEWIHDNVVANWGWAIVLMTVFIKILLLPLTHKSYVSMRKMQELNPKMQAINHRWAGKLKDKQGRPNLDAQRKKNEEMQALFREEGVNPAGGCLPMLLQFPVFIAFYKLLYQWVELRGAPWMGWIEDLSVRDPIYALPIIMVAAQFMQTWMAPSTGNPMQRKLMLFMPFFFGFIFLKFPAGLVLYWLTNNVLSIAQQTVYNRYKDRQENEAGQTAKAKKSHKESKTR